MEIRPVAISLSGERIVRALQEFRTLGLSVDNHSRD